MYGETSVMSNSRNALEDVKTKCDNDIRCVVAKSEAAQHLRILLDEHKVIQDYDLGNLLIELYQIKRQVEAAEVYLMAYKEASNLPIATILPEEHDPALEKLYWAIVACFSTLYREMEGLPRMEPYGKNFAGLIKTNRDQIVRELRVMVVGDNGMSVMLEDILRGVSYHEGRGWT